jgi:CRISPR-associated protein Cas6
MFWEEDVAEKPRPVSDEVIDLAFSIECRCLPLDHAYALSQAVQAALPWLAQEPEAGLHLIHGAESGNGWQRPDGDLLYLSRRAKLILRLPRRRMDEALELSGQTLTIAGYPLKVGKAASKPLSPLSVQFARYVLAREEQDEAEFLRQAMQELEAMGIRCRKALCGKTASIDTPQGKVFTRSLMLADLSQEDAVLLEQKGLGKGRKFGCGLFVPHKDIKPVDPDKLG